ncbi:NlpC/P60 family peptidoglycan endopeptidase RipA [Candidatus Mycobacterium methanotrophicum]|uniref:NlpC/P60 family peptidoglycan endopeptidase RipA n=1 Tax=Candidatus Mycobacterium methanotrophicum TaxID=2943498 RepID=A0ABY4QE81_9MYCO|nr:NlpC/P60 family peptidoglycan endopeptidase RipA [Candidatus Mycobacterium methanotrophicum]UQX09312.1 NlpC/P60 family peptidoglycan endopeptidase RipA [Candidatus Mycobacterium methanotrophicum]
MRRNRRGSSFRLAARLTRRVAPIALSLAVTLCTPGLANADPSAEPNTMAKLIADVASANQRLHDLSAQIQTEEESVNKAVVDVETARDNAAATQHNVEASQQAVKDANAAIAAAQKRFDRFAVASYVNGPSDSYFKAAGPDDIVATAAAGQTLAASSGRAMNNLRRARTEQVNRESAARLAKQKADKAVADAQSSQNAAVAALTDVHRKFGEQQQEVNRLADERNAAQARLDAARNWSKSAGGPGARGQAAPTLGSPGDRWDPAAPGSPNRSQSNGGNWDGEWDPTLPMVPSANVPGDPVAVLNKVLGISATSSQVTADMGHKFLQQLGLIKPDTPDSGITNGRIPRVYGRQASEYVIRRGLSQLGVPYSWGGGNAAGPSHGIGSGSGTVGFDCSGLVLYSFAGVGIKLPHYSGSQYNLGRKVPSSQMRRGDVIFYGPGGSQHVTIYLGQGQMLEAPDVGLKVRVAPVRTSGMTPYVVRYIEY